MSVGQLPEANMIAEWVKHTTEGGLCLPVCVACSKVQYPLRDRCVNCLSDQLEWQAVSNSGEVLANTVLHYTLDQKFESKLPVHVASIRLDAGPVVIAFSTPGLKSGQRVFVVSRKTGSAGVSLFAEAD